MLWDGACCGSLSVGAKIQKIGRKVAWSGGNYSKIIGRTPSAYLYWESPDGEKSFKIYTESNRILGEAPVGASYISAPYGRKLIKIILKINQKFIGEHRWCSLAWVSLFEREIHQKLSSKINQK